MILYCNESNAGHLTDCASTFVSDFYSTMETGHRGDTAEAAGQVK